MGWGMQGRGGLAPLLTCSPASSHPCVWGLEPQLDRLSLAISTPSCFQPAPHLGTGTAGAGSGLHTQSTGGGGAMVAAVPPGWQHQGTLSGVHYLVYLEHPGTRATVPLGLPTC